ncbi:MAG: glycosyltransferase family 2 protein, partial [Bacteroidota bacterium]|nr:glycosyltransferase family 2 protein [Bacteroidota bacterium]
MPRVSIVILNWNGLYYLQRFLPSVMATQYANLDIVLADNASTDASVGFVQENFPSIRIIRLEKNLGFAGGYNEALKQVEADYFVLLNSDVEVSAGWIQPVIELMEADKSIGAVQPKILMETQRSRFEYAGAS